SQEFVAAQKLGADRPEAHLALARYHTRQRQFERAESELKLGLAIDPAFVPAAVNLADLYRTLGRDPEAQDVLRNALAHAGKQPSLVYALGLLMVRERHLHEATQLLKEAAARGPQNPRFGYVYAVALHDSGQLAEALSSLKAVIGKHPYDRDSLAALQAFCRE